jgi:hypothetical protein
VRRTIQDWQTGLDYPTASRLQALIAAILHAGGLSAGQERPEATALLDRRRPRVVANEPPFDSAWFVRLLEDRDGVLAVPAPESHTLERKGGGVRGLRRGARYVRMLRCVRDAPPAGEWLTGVIGFLSDQQRAAPHRDSERLAALLQSLRGRRSLLVLDNCEALFERGQAGTRGTTILSQAGVRRGTTIA